MYTALWRQRDNSVRFRQILPTMQLGDVADLWIGKNRFSRHATTTGAMEPPRARVHAAAAEGRPSQHAHLPLRWTQVIVLSHVYIAREYMHMYIIYVLFPSSLLRLFVHLLHHHLPVPSSFIHYFLPSFMSAFTLTLFRVVFPSPFFSFVPAYLLHLVLPSVGPSFIVFSPPFLNPVFLLSFLLSSLLLPFAVEFSRCSPLPSCLPCFLPSCLLSFRPSFVHSSSLS